MPLISRRQALAPIAGALAAPALPAQAYAPQPASPQLPSHYDEPLGIGLEGWPYPAALRWQQCSVGGQPCRMAYMDVAPTGRPRNKTVVLMHGKNLDSSYWTRQIKDLSGAGYRVLVPDQIGFHKSSKPDVPYSLDLLAELTVNLLGALQIGQASVLGHSLGGMMAVRLATTFPQRVDRLILEAPIGLVDYRRFIPPPALDALLVAEKRRTVSSYRAFLKQSMPSLAAKDMEPFVEWRMRLAQSGEFDRFCKAAALTYQMMYRDPVRAQFDVIAAPTLMIVGDKDQTAPFAHYVSPEAAAKMPPIPQAAADAVKDMRKGSLATIPGVGHVPHLEAPDAFGAHVLTFLAA